jgi:hypothetical protein
MIRPQPLLFRNSGGGSTMSRRSGTEIQTILHIYADNMGIIAYFVNKRTGIAKSTIITVSGGIMRIPGKAYLAFVLFFTAALSAAQAFVDVEAGPAFTGYNDVAIPANTGSRISLQRGIVSDPALSVRVRGGYTFADRHTVLFLYSPLTVRGKGTLDSDITYAGKTFLKGSAVESVYRFDSYRLTYRFALIENEILQFGLGLTGKLRSADIALMSDSGYAHRIDLGVVPLINFRLQWAFAHPFSILLDGDALVTPFGRAEDALLAFQYSPSDRVSWRIGYRVLEGGADGGGNVYTFALFHYAMAGIAVTF